MLSASSSVIFALMSLPSRERGLKYHAIIQILAPKPVAPLAGAWIEIDELHPDSTRAVSLPSRERGLKFCKVPVRRTGRMSLPSRERGLKYGLYFQKDTDDESLPSRERGLKYTERSCGSRAGRVAPLAGAWIEMLIWYVHFDDIFSRSPRGSVD